MMRRKSFGFVVAVSLLALGVGARVQAGTMPFNGSLTLQFGPPIPATFLVEGTGVATVNGLHINALQLPASPFAASNLSVNFTSRTTAAAGVILTAHNAAGTFTDMGKPLGGQMSINGVMKVCLFVACTAPPANITVPLNVVGVGGSSFVNALNNYTVTGAPWTEGTASVGTLTAMGFQHGPASLASSTAQSAGALRLVTPIFITTTSTVAGGNQRGPAILGLGTLDLHFVPEPATALLLGGGIAGLVLFGRTKTIAATRG